MAKGSSVESSQDGRRLPVLDGVRGVALLLVVLYHTVGFSKVAARTPLEQIISHIASEGWVGVDLFFVLSGFLITGILLRTRQSEHFYRNFMLRRVLRIFPLYYLFIVIFFLVLPPMLPQHAELQKLPPLQAWYWLYIPNFRIFLQGDWSAIYAEHTWSLAIEEQFYLVWPLVVLFAGARRLPWIAILGLVGSLAFRVWIARDDPGFAKTLVLMPAHLDGLMLGSILAVMMEQYPEKILSRRLWMVLLIVVCMAGMLATGLSPLNYTTKHYALNVTWVSILFTALIGLLVTARPGSLLERVFSNRVLRFVGFYSYGLYLFHEAVFRELGKNLPTRNGPALVHWAAIVTIGSVISLLLAVAVYRLYEARFLSLKRFL
jgi:peptidoglycan/LPS O-acetylase OafA/YrhL